MNHTFVLRKIALAIFNSLKACLVRRKVKTDERNRTKPTWHVFTQNEVMG